MLRGNDLLFRVFHLPAEPFMRPLCSLESYEDGFERILWFCIFVNVQQSSLDIAGPDVGRCTVFLGWT